MAICLWVLPWWCHNTGMLSTLFTFCEGTWSYHSPVNFPHTGQVMHNFDALFFCWHKQAVEQTVKLLMIRDVMSTLVQVMAWCSQETSHYLSQCWPSSMLPYNIIRPHWVNWGTISWHNAEPIISGLVQKWEMLFIMCATWPRSQSPCGVTRPQ